MMDERSQPTIRALDCPALGLVPLLAALITLPDPLSLVVAAVFGRAALVASAICAVLLVTVVAWLRAMFDPTSPLGFWFSPQVVGRPLAALLALLATLAWSQRSTSPKLPRATLRSG